MKTRKIYLLLFIITTNLIFCQISGNRVYGENDNYYKIQNDNGFNLTDGILSFKVKVLMNKKADKFIITLGLNEEANSVENCNKQINQRITDFITKITKNTIKKEELYVDFISQTKIYDYTITSSRAEEFEKGFEIKKNIIIATNSLKNIDLIIETASEFKIYNIIKVDYLSDDSLSIYNNLFDEALKIAEMKKNKYLKSFNKKSLGNPTASDEFSVITPENQYKNYKAFESSDVELNNRWSMEAKKILRKNSTFYYDGISQSGIDKSFNDSTPVVGIQYYLVLTISYKIDTSL